MLQQSRRTWNANSSHTSAGRGETLVPRRHASSNHCRKQRDAGTCLMRSGFISPFCRLRICMASRVDSLLVLDMALALSRVPVLASTPRFVEHEMTHIVARETDDKKCSIQESCATIERKAADSATGGRQDQRSRPRKNDDRHLSYPFAESFTSTRKWFHKPSIEFSSPVAQNNDRQGGRPTRASHGRGRQGRLMEKK